MKSILILCSVFISILSYSQKNEIITYSGLTPNGSGVKPGSVFQLKYERHLSNKFGLQTGFRYHNYIEPNERTNIVDGLATTSHFIQSSYTSKKLDVSLLFIPINNTYFKLKFAAGLDVGRSLYTFAYEGWQVGSEYPEGFVVKEFFRYQIVTLTDYGMHYSITAGYYLKNNMFFSAQAMYNQVFDEEVDYSFTVRASTINFSLGIGYRF